jgi:acetolactate decarboxylase
MAVAALSMLSCAVQDIAVDADENRAYTVEWVGEMMRVHREGDASPKVALADVARGAGRFAIGPVAGLRGEITVIDGEAHIATAADNAEHVTQDWEQRAPFLVYGTVNAWKEVAAPVHAASIADIEAWLPVAAQAQGLDVEQPIPFKIETTSSRIDYHIIANDAAGYQTMRPHKELQKPFVLENKPAVLIGVYSTKHAGIFTHHGSSSHIHVVSQDGRHSGHVDALTPGPDAKYFLPAP